MLYLSWFFHERGYDYRPADDFIFFYERRADVAGYSDVVGKKSS
jgi:hypothetical protein